MSTIGEKRREAGQKAKETSSEIPSRKPIHKLIQIFSQDDLGTKGGGKRVEEAAPTVSPAARE